MKDPFDAPGQARLARLEEQLRLLLPLSPLEGAQRLSEALEYELRSGGKRVRPLLTLDSAEIFGVPENDALRLACAVEYLHLASVILDDLPSMDDAQTRRHLPALHVVFGEAIATLAALSLYARAFEILAEWPVLAREAARAVGSEGMIGGQAADLCGRHADRLAKTTPLIRFALSAPARLARANAAAIAAIEEFGELLGQAYQLCDDLLDALATEDRTGKTAHQDLRHNRPALAPGAGPRELYAHLRALVRRAVATVRGGLPPCAASGRLIGFAAWLERQAGELFHGDRADPAHCLRAGAGCGQRDPLAEG